MLKRLCWKLNLNQILTQKVSESYLNLTSNMLINHILTIFPTLLNYKFMK